MYIYIYMCICICICMYTYIYIYIYIYISPGEGSVQRRGGGYKDDAVFVAELCEAARVPLEEGQHQGEEVVEVQPVQRLLFPGCRV